MNKKITILSLSLITILAGAAVSPALGAIGTYFSDASPLLIGLIVSLPAIFIACTSILSSNLFKVLSIKQAVIIGVCLYLIGGVGGAFATSIQSLLVYRAILGIGTGIILPISTGLIALYYDPSEQRKLMGLSSACNNLGGIIAMILSGILVGISWRMAFFVYAIALVPLVLMICFLPNDRMPNDKKQKNINSSVFPFMLISFMTMLVFYIYLTNFSRIITAQQLFDVKYLGIIMSTSTASAFLVGFNFSKIMNKLGDKVVVISTISFFMSYLLLFIGNGILTVIISALLIGFGPGILIPFVNSTIAHKVERENVTFVMSINGFFIFMGQFVSPFMVSLLENFNNSNNIKFPFAIGIVLSIILLITAEIILKKQND